VEGPTYASPWIKKALGQDAQEFGMQGGKSGSSKSPFGGGGDSRNRSRATPRRGNKDARNTLANAVKGRLQEALLEDSIWKKYGKIQEKRDLRRGEIKTFSELREKTQYSNGECLLKRTKIAETSKTLLSTVDSEPLGE